MALKDAEAVPRMAAALGNVLGTFGRIAFSVGFWAAVFASLLGVWQSVPYLYADFYGIVTKMPLEERRELVKVTSTPYRLALAFISLVPIPFAFTGQPIQIVIIYTIVSSLFVPFVAATLLYLNNRVAWTEPVPKNSLDHQSAAGRDPRAVRDRRRAGSGGAAGQAIRPTGQQANRPTGQQRCTSGKVATEYQAKHRSNCVLS